jgi:adenylate cyclase
MEPMKLRALLTQYFTKMIDIMQENNGTLDKLIGDAIMCFFGVPISTPEHHLQAARTAWGMQLGLKELNAEWVKQGLPELGMRIGVNSGQVVAGNIGTDTLFNYTIMGDCVNLGARLESANKFYGTNLMVGEATQPYIKDEFELRQLDLVKVKGKDKAVAIYEMLGPKGKVAADKLQNREIYETALNHYFEGVFEQAAALFQQNIDDFQDTAAVLLLERCHVLIEEPPRQWDGVYAWTSK